MPTPPQRILIVMALATQKGGGELMLLHLLQEHQKLGVEWFVVFLEDGPMVQTVRGWGISAFVVPAGRLRQPGKTLGAIRTIAKLAKENQIDLLLGWMGKAHLYAGTAALMTGKQAMWYQLGTPSRRNLLEWVINAVPAKAIISCGPEGQIEQAKFLPSRKGALVTPGVEMDRFDPATLPSPADARRELKLPPAGPLIGIVGRMQRWKGIHVLVEAMPAVLAKHPDAHAVIVGGTHDLELDYPREIEQLIARLNLDEKILRVGLQSNVPVWMQAMDVFVHASDHEPFGIVVLEAMALGKPVVAGSEGGPKTIITPGVDGELSPYGDASALAAAILRYLDEPARAAEIGSRARLRAEAFAVPFYAEKLVRTIQDLSHA